jgi:hypothetical protein
LVNVIAGKTSMMLAAAALSVGVTACGSAVPQASAGLAASGSPAAPASRAVTDTPRAACRAAQSAGSLQALVEPEAGIGSIYQLVTDARSSVDLTMYELADPHRRGGPAS